MTRRILSILLTLCIVLCLVPTSAFADGETESGNISITGGGTANDPYLIYSAEDLKAFRDKVNNGQKDACAKLMDDIVLNDGTFDEDGNYTAPDGSSAEPNQWVPIGTGNNKYNGTFDGNGKTVKGLYINTESDEAAGLFGYAASPKIRNLTVDGRVTGKNAVGGILGMSNGGVIENCTNNAAVTIITNDIHKYAGGIAGLSYAKFIGCSNTGIITGENSPGILDIGGIVGYHNNVAPDAILDCYNTGIVRGKAKALYLGGVAGFVVGAVRGCYNVGNLYDTGSEVSCVGGIVGLNCSFYDLTDDYYLESTAEKAVGKNDGGGVDENTVKAITKEKIENGTLTGLLINGRENGTHSWSSAYGYFESTGMVLPILKTQENIYAHIHCICGGDKIVGDHTVHTDIDWVPWTSTDSLPTKAGNYYLVNDVAVIYDLEKNSGWVPKENISICLNGKTISSNGTIARLQG